MNLERKPLSGTIWNAEDCHYEESQLKYQNMETLAMKEKKISTSTIAIIALMAAVTCILGPLSLPIGPVPISLTTMVLYFTAVLLGWKKGTVSCLLYLLIGLVGIPVFSGFTAGPGKLLGPTGGYMIGYIFLTMISGWFIEKFPGKRAMYFAGMILGTIVCYTLGTAWLAYEAKMTLQAALMAGVVPFIPGDLIKMVLAILIAPLIKSPLVKAGYLR